MCPVLLMCVQVSEADGDFDDDRPIRFTALREATKAHFDQNPLVVVKNQPVRIPLVG